MKRIILLALYLLASWSTAQAQGASVDEGANPSAPLVGGERVRVLVDLSALLLTLYSPEGTVEKTLPLATGAGVAPTHPGTKIVNAKLGDSPQESDVGTHLIDLSWYDPDSKFRVKSDEEMHGVHVHKSLGCNASHACIRLHNSDFEWLYERLTVGDVVLVRD